MTSIAWKSGVSGGWTTSNDWTPVSVPAIGDDVTIAAAGTYVVSDNVGAAANSITVNDAGATLDDTSTMTLASSIVLNAGTFSLDSGGTLQGGTIAVAGGIFQINNGTLSGVTSQGAINLTAANAYLSVAGGLTATQAGGSGDGTVNLTGAATNLRFLNGQTFDHATINIGSAGQANAARLTEQDVAGSGATLTLGTSLNLLSNGGDGLLLATDTAANDGLVNAGTIGFGGSGGTTEISANSFANVGRMSVSNGGTLDLLTGFYGPASGEVGSNAGSITISSGLLAFGRSFVNTGSVVATGGTITLSGTFSTTGTFQANNTTLAIGGTISGSSLLALLNNASDTVTYTASYDNTSAVLNIGSGSAVGTLSLNSSLPISNGTIADAGGGFLFNGGTLTNVAYQGTIDMSRNGSALTIASNLVAAATGGGGPGTVTLSGTSSQLSFLDNQTFTNATVNVGSSVVSSAARLQEHDSTGNGATLTLGPSLQIVSNGGYGVLQATDTLGNDGLVNQGVVQVATAGGLVEVIANSFTNQGTLLAGNGGTLDLLTGYYSTPPGEIGTNSGVITATGGVLGFGGNFTNNGSIAVNGGTLTVAGVFADAGSLSATNASVTLGGVFSGVNFLKMLNTASDVVTVTGTYDNTGRTLNVGSGTALGTIDLVSGLPIRGGTIVDSGGGLVLAGGTLDGVTYVGTLAAGNHGSVSVLDGLVVQTGTGGGPGIVNLTAGWSSMNFANSQALGNLLVSVGDATGSTDSLYDTAAGGTVTLGTDVVVQQSTGVAQVYTYGGAATVNKGTIAVSGGTFEVNNTGGSFANAGRISVSNGATFEATAFLGSSQFSNSGVLSATTGATVTLEAGWSNTGTISVNGATLQLGSDSTTAWSSVGTIQANNATLELEGVLTTAQLTQLSLSGGTTELMGVLQNAGNVLFVGNGSAVGTLTMAGGTIDGGTIADAGDGMVFGDGTLDGVTYRGVLTVGSGGDVWVKDGLTALPVSGNGGGTINLTGGGSGLFVLDSETLDNAIINIGDNSSSTDFIQAYVSPSAGTLTLGSNLSVNQSVGDAAVFTATGDTTLNDGRIVVTGGTFHVDYGVFVNAGTISVSGPTAQFNDNLPAFANAGLLTATTGGGIALQAGWSNTGTISASGGATLQLGSDTTTAWGAIGTIAASGATLDLYGSFSTAQLLSLNLANDAAVVDGTLANSGATLSIGSGTALVSLGSVSGGVVRGGVIADAGGGLVAQGGTLDGVTYRGTMAVGAGGSLNVIDGLTLQGLSGGSGAVTLTGGGSTLAVLDSETLDHATVQIGDASGTADFLVDGGSNGNTLTLGTNLVLQQSVGWAQLLSNGAADLTINNGQVIVSGGTLDISGGKFSNAGTIAVSGGGTVKFETGTLGNFANSTLTSGVWVVGAGSTLQMPQSTSVATLAADVTLSGSGSTLQSTNSSGVTTMLDTTLRTIAAGGALRLLAGRSLTIPGNLLDAGLLQLGGGAMSNNATIAASGLLFGYGTVGGSVNDNGLVDATGGLLTLRSHTTGTGQLQVDAAGTLELGSTSALASNFNKVGGTLRLDIPSSYTGAIAGFAVGDTLVLGGVTASAASITGNVLNVSLTNGKKLAYSVGGSFAGLKVQTATVAGNTVVTLVSTRITGTLNNQGATLLAGNGTTYTLSGGKVLGGTIADAGGGFVVGTGTLDGVTYRGALAVGAGGSLNVINGLTLQSVSGGSQGSVTLTGGGSVMAVLDSETLDNATVQIGDVSGAADILVNGGSNGNTLTLGTNLVLQQSTGWAQLLSSGAGDVTVNNAQVIVSGGTLDISGGKLSNAGTVAVSGGGTVKFETGTLGNFASSALTGGVWVVGAGSTLQLPSYSFIHTVAADVTLSGTGSQIQSLNTSNAQIPLDLTLQTIAVGGALRLLAGRSLAMPVALSDQGLLQLGGGTLSNSGITTVSGTLSGFGAVSGRLTDNGLVEANGGRLVMVTAPIGTGRMQVDGGATLELTSTDALASNFNGAGGTLQLDQPTTYSGAINGFAIGDSLVLGSVTASAASITGNTLNVNLTNGKTLAYAVGGNFAGLSVQNTEVAGNATLTLATTPKAADVAAAATATPIAVSQLSLGTAGFLDATGQPSGQVVAASASGETLPGTAGVRHIFQGVAAAFNHDAIGPLTGSGAATDMIDLTDLGFDPAKVRIESGAGGSTLSFSDGSHSGSLSLLGGATAAQFTMMRDLQGGTLLVHH